MPVIATSVDLKSEEAGANRTAWRELSAELAERRATAAQ